MKGCPMPDRSIHDGTVANAAVDYVTAVGENKSGQKNVEILGLELIDLARRDGNKQHRSTARGRDVISAGWARLERGDDRSILRVSGPHAASACRQAVGIADNLSRIDLQTTVRFNRDISSLAREHERELRRVQRERGAPLYTSLILSRSRGDTLYVGSRRSAYFGRVYNKRLESKDPAYDRCWRYEVEVKSDGTRSLAKRIESGELEAPEISALVAGWFRRHGADVRYRPGVADAFTSIGAIPTDVQKRLKWLREAVIPSLEWLKQWYSEDDLHAFLFGGVQLPDVTDEGGGYVRPG
jgi:hypothetical protein